MRPTLRVLSVLILAVCGFGAGRGSDGLITLDFVNTGHNDTAIVSEGPIYTDQGFQLLTTGPNVGDDAVFASPGSLRYDYDGEPSIYAGNSNARIELTRADGDVFSLVSIDLAEFPNGMQNPDGTVGARPADGPFTITFTGIRKNGRTVTTSALVQPFDTILTFAFPGDFRNLVAVEWSQGPGGTAVGLATHQFSNIQVEGRFRNR
jgi:hypothetical protein